MFYIGLLEFSSEWVEIAYPTSVLFAKIRILRRVNDGSVRLADRVKLFKNQIFIFKFKPKQVFVKMYRLITDFSAWRCKRAEVSKNLI